MSVEQKTEKDFKTEVKVENYEVEAILDFCFCNTDQVKILYSSVLHFTSNIINLIRVSISSCSII